MSTRKMAPTESAIWRKRSKVDDARIGAAARDDQLWFVFFGQLGELVVVDALILAAYAVGNHV